MAEQIYNQNIVDEMRTSYLEYAMSVIVGRALPDVRDGLKPVHRRVLFAMHDQGNDYNKPYRKSARVVGDVIGKYHPHGDAAVYDTIVRMSQDFSLRYQLVDGQGNFGSIDGDSPAAMRYTEIRMKKLAHELLVDLEKDTVDFTPNYDDSLSEPSVLPTRIPNLLINGSTGIAVGMASNIPPHNLGEIMNALLYYIDHRDATVADLMQFIPGPDFPTGGTIIGRKGIFDAYTTGRGILKVRAKSHIETEKNDREAIIITELPFMVNKANLVEKIAELVRDKKIEGISDMRDESDRKGMRIYIQIKRNENANVVLSNLYKHTALQSSFGVIMLAIVERQPKILPLKKVLQYFVEHRMVVVTRRTRFELRQAEAKAHILQGLTIALDHLDDVIEIIRGAQSGPIAQTLLMEKYQLSKEQSHAILEMRLQRLTGLERDKIRGDYDETMAAIANYKSILSDDHLVLDIIRKECQEILEKYNDPRRTEIIEGDSSIAIEELINEEDMVVTISHSGYVKCSPVSEYRLQRRGGKGRQGMNTKDEDFVEKMIVASTHDYLLIFTNMGQVFSKKVFQLPSGGPNTRGKAIINILPLRPDEKICTYLRIPQNSEGKYILMCTAKGICKKIHLLDCDRIRVSGIRGITLDEGDSLISAQLTDGNSELFFATRNGMGLRVHENEIRPMGRTARGVIGIRMRGDDQVVSAIALTGEGQLLTVTANGFGKKTPIDSYTLSKHRGNLGVKNIKSDESTGQVVGTMEVMDHYQLFIITQGGKLILIPVGNIPSTVGRVTRGSRLIRMAKDEFVIAIAPVMDPEEIDADVETAEVLLDQEVEIDTEDELEQETEEMDEEFIDESDPDSDELDE
ncbi:MAG: DNA gyrase subunit A [SAR324 cluster bacterium]|nr:DNA gyrase subunit A [SAR324 cluster bacterium]